MLKLMYPKELAQYIVSQLNLNRVDFREFPACSFAVKVPLYEGTLEEIKANSCGWYGIHSIDPEFDSTFTLYLIGDYYGGGCAHFISIENGDPPEDAIKQIHTIIRTMLEVGEDIYEEQLLIIEFA